MESKNRKLAELAKLVNGEILGDADLVISGLADLDSAEQGEITFIVKAHGTKEINSTRASAVILPSTVSKSPKPAIRVNDPYLAAAIIQNHFLNQPFIAEGISDKAHIGTNCQMPDEVSIGPMVVIGDNVTCGERLTLKPGVVIGNNVVIGSDVVIHANATVAEGCSIGNRVTIHSGTVIGSDGFGYATDEKGYHIKRPHLGIVQIDDDVEIGANVSIDKGTFGKTWIRQGVKIDNLVQIAHNVEVGENSLLVAQVGIAGSSSLGRNVVLGGQAGVKGHVRLEDGVMAGAKAGVHGNHKKGAIISGYPAIPLKNWLKSSTIFAKLPELYQEVRELRKKIADLQKKD